MDAKNFLEEVGRTVTERFVQDRSLLSFDEYLQGYLARPDRHARSAAQYLLDVFDHYGTREIPTPGGVARRFHLFDVPFVQGKGRVAGEEQVQNAIYRIVRNFVRQGRVDRLVLLHGPNGSSKSSIAAAIMAGLEDYSRRPEGAVYRFNWVFPSEKLEKGPLGFGGGVPTSEAGLASYAHLPDSDIESRLVCEMKDHPLLLIPKAERQRLLTATVGAQADGDAVIPEYLWRGDVCHKCRTVFDALMAGYGGDWSKVMVHVQVERFYYSRRYLTGAAVVEPQMSVDAGARILSPDRSAAGLPASLQSVNLIESMGALVNANRGVVEYSDLLKRPLEAFKYLLGTSETGEVRMEHLTLLLDTILLATSNELHLSAFKEIPDWTSFKGRIELVRVPYLRRLSEERKIYEDQVTPASVGKHIAPHAIDTASRWAVLTRLVKPQAHRYPEGVQALVDSLSPMEKLRLYDAGEAPARLSMRDARELKSVLDRLWHESDAWPNYEGQTGASAREIKTVLFNAAQNPARACLTTSSVLDELQNLVKDKTVYAFLRQEAEGGYHDHEAFVESAGDAWLDKVDDEVRDALGLVAEEQYREWFERYVVHVTHWVKGEKLKNRVTGEYEPPDEKMMSEMEAIIVGEEEGDEFRRSLIGGIGAYRLEHPDETELAYPSIFRDLFKRLRDHYHGEHRRQLVEAHEAFLKYGDPDERKSLSDRARTQVEEMLSTLRERYGYCDECARDAMLALVKKRYRE